MIDSDVDALYESKLTALKQKEALSLFYESVSTTYGIENVMHDSVDTSALFMLDLAYNTDVTDDLKECLLRKLC